METLLSCFPQLFKYGSESSTGAKVSYNEMDLRVYGNIAFLLSATF